MKILYFYMFSVIMLINFFLPSWPTINLLKTSGFFTYHQV